MQAQEPFRHLAECETRSQGIDDMYQQGWLVVCECTLKKSQGILLTIGNSCKWILWMHSNELHPSEADNIARRRGLTSRGGCNGR